MAVMRIRIIGADPHHFDADPDPACPFDADPDPACHFEADPDPDPNFHRRKTLKSAQIGSYSIYFWLVICKLMRILIQIQLIILTGIRIQLSL
jgi:hypothetical protein